MGELPWMLLRVYHLEEVKANGLVSTAWDKSAIWQGYVDYRASWQQDRSCQWPPEAQRDEKFSVESPERF